MAREKEVPEAIRRELEAIRARMRDIRYKILVVSGKGGVGKSFVTANLAVALHQRGRKVGVLDADIHGPSIPKMLGVHGQRLYATPAVVFPVRAPCGVFVVSMDFLLPDETTPVIWRGPLKATAIRQLLASVEWGGLDYLLVDLPPGTGDEPLSAAQLIGEVTGVVLVTIPSDVSRLVVSKAVSFARHLGVPVLGVIENMSYFTCPICGSTHRIFGEGAGHRIAEAMNVPFLGEIPIDPRIAECGDRGVPFVTTYPDTPAAQAFLRIADRIAETIERQ